MDNFTEKLINKWEKKSGLKVKGFIEIGKGKQLVYWDNDFVKNLLDYARILYERTEDLKKKLGDILEQTKA